MSHAESFVGHLRSLDAGELRICVQYDGDDREVLYRHPELDEQFTDPELDEVVKHLVLKGFDDSVEQPEFARLGHLDATVRWFHEAVVVQVPLDDWSGVIASFDRETVDHSGDLVDGVLDFVDEELPGHGDDEDVTEQFEAEFSQ